MSDHPMIAFRGLKGLIDKEAVREFAQMQGCTDLVLLQWQEVDRAEKLIAASAWGSYHLLGFSKGAESCRELLARLKKRRLPLPYHTHIIGPYGARSYADLKVPHTVWRDDSGKAGPDGHHLGGAHLGPEGILKRVVAASYGALAAARPEFVEAAWTPPEGSY